MFWRRFWILLLKRKVLKKYNEEDVKNLKVLAEKAYTMLRNKLIL